MSQMRKPSEHDPWAGHQPSPVDAIAFTLPNIEAQFQEMHYEERGSWDITSPDLHIASLVTPALHRYGRASNQFMSIAPSSAIALPGERVAGSWQGKMVGRHLFLSVDQFRVITGRELRKCQIGSRGFTPQSDVSSQIDIPAQLLGILAQNAKCDMATGSMFAETIVSALLQNLLGPQSKIFGYCGKQAPNSDRIVHSAIDIIQSSLSERVVLMDIAQEIGVSVQYLCRVFKQSTGMSPHQYLLRERVFLARALIVKSQLSLVEIALESGFSDHSQLSTTFKKLLGYSPSSLRN